MKIWSAWYRNLLGKFQKIRKVLTFRNANHSTENPGNSKSIFSARNAFYLQKYVQEYVQETGNSNAP